MRAETGGLFQAQNAGEQSEFGSQTTLRLTNPPELRGFLWVPLLRAGKALEGLKHENDDQRTGIEIVRKAVQWPARQIVENAGVDGSIVVGKLTEHKDYAYG